MLDGQFCAIFLSQKISSCYIDNTFFASLVAIKLVVERGEIQVLQAAVSFTHARRVGGRAVQCRTRKSRQ